MGYSVRACLKKKERKGGREGKRFKNKQKALFTSSLKLGFLTSVYLLERVEHKQCLQYMVH